MSKKANLQEYANGEDSNGLEQKSECGAIKFVNDDSCIGDKSTSLEDLDEPDGWFGFKNKQSTESKLHNKVAECDSLIKKQIEMKEANVTEYLDSVQGKLDKGQKNKLKSNFERTNQKCSHNIEYLHRKKDSYLKRLQDMEKRRASLAVVPSINGPLIDFKRPSISSIKSLTFKMSTPPPASISCSSADDAVSANCDDHVTSKTSLKGLQSVKHHLANESLRMTSFLVAGCKSKSFADLSPRVEFKEFISQNNSNLSSEMKEPKPLKDNRGFDLAKQKVKELNENNKRLTTAVRELQMKLEGIIRESQMLIDERVRRSHLQKNMFELIGRQQEEITCIRKDLQNIEEQIELKVYEKSKEIQKTIESCQYQIFQLEHVSSNHHLELLPDSNICTKYLGQFAIKALDHLLTFVAAIFIVLATMASNLRHYQLNAGWSQKLFSFLVLACMAGAFVFWNVTWDYGSRANEL